MTGSPRSGLGGSRLFPRLLYVAYFLEVGLLLMVLPWSDFWEHNYFAQAWPILTPVITNSFVCGGVTGLGIANVLVGVSDLARVFSTRAADVAAAPLEPRTDTRIEP